VKESLAELELAPLAGDELIDAGAEEELFRRLGQEAAGEQLRQRWEAADGPRILLCQRCQKSLKPMGHRSKQLQTICGSLTLQRRVYYCAECGQLEVPLDQRLGIGQGRMTAGLMRLVCRTALELPFQQSQQLLSDTLGFRACSPREVERVAGRHGQLLETEPLSPGTRRRPAKPRYCLAIDGSMIPGLPDHTTHRLCWHEVKLAVGFDAQEVDAPFYIAGREDAESFGERLWQQLQQRGLDHDSFQVILGDGAPWIWNLADLHLPGVPQLLDFYHAAEHLFATAQLLWPAGKGNAWWQRRLAQLKQGELTNFFAALRRLKRTHPNLAADSSPKRLLQYFEDNQGRLRYHWALTQHLPIGSGAVESGARHIVQQRLKQSGMRWSDPGAQAVLNLRTLHRNGDFEQYWANLAAVGF
jgi:hypothetical protein